jgi:hypothetical protein
MASPPRTRRGPSSSSRASVVRSPDDEVASTRPTLSSGKPSTWQHPARYRIAFQRVVPGLRPGPELTAARQKAWGQLQAKVQRLDDAGLLGHKSVREAAVEFNAMLEGLANAELRGAVFRNLPEGGEELAWRNALATVIDGFSTGVPSEARRTPL